MAFFDVVQVADQVNPPFWHRPEQGTEQEPRMNPKARLLDAVIELISYAHTNELNDACMVLRQLLSDISTNIDHPLRSQAANLTSAPSRLQARLALDQ